MAGTDHYPEPTIYKRREVEALLRISRTTLYDKVAAGTFPRPIKLGPRASGWPASEVHQWLADRMAERYAAVTTNEAADVL